MSSTRTTGKSASAPSPGGMRVVTAQRGPPHPGVGDEGVPVLGRAADREERVAGAAGAAVDRHAGDERLQASPDERALGAADQLGETSGAARRVSTRFARSAGEELADHHPVVERQDLAGR